MIFILLTLINIASAVIPVSKSQIIGKWSDVACSKEYIEFTSGGEYKYYIWNGAYYVPQQSAYWWIDDGYVAVGNSKYNSDNIIGVIAVETINSQYFSGGYATANGSMSQVTMIKCRG